MPNDTYGVLVILFCLVNICVQLFKFSFEKYSSPLILFGCTRMLIRYSWCISLMMKMLEFCVCHGRKCQGFEYCLYPMFSGEMFVMHNLNSFTEICLGIVHMVYYNVIQFEVQTY